MKRLKTIAIVFTGVLSLLMIRASLGDDDIPLESSTQQNSYPDVSFSRELIPPIDVLADQHISSVKNGVRFDVYFDNGPKNNAAIYAINTGRKQLVLTPKHHKAILEDLVDRKFTVIVADFGEKKLRGVDLEKYVVQLTADAREVADGVLTPKKLPGPTSATSKTETYANDYFTLMPGFTVQRDIAWFRYGDIPAAFRREIAKHLDKPIHETDADKVNTYDIIYPVYGPAVGVLTNYGSNEKGRENYYPSETKYLVQAFALKNLAVVHQQYFNDPVGGYPKGYSYYGDQFAVAFLRNLMGNAARYHINTQKICCFGHSKGSEVPGMLVNKLRTEPNFLCGKAKFKKIRLSEKEMTISSPYGTQSTAIACAILGAGVANNEMRSDKTLPWGNDPAKNISPFFVFADHGELMRQRTQELVAKAKEHGVVVETVDLDSHTWPFGDAYDKASAFADRILQLDN